MAAPLSIDGLVSGLDTTSIVDAIMAVERRSVTLLEARQARASAQRDAFRSLNTKLLSFQAKAQALSGSAAFRQRIASVSDETLLTATAVSGAATGTYAVAVRSLARAHQIASQGYADTDTTTLGTGTLQIQIGNGETTTIDVTSANNTLAGLRDAINAAGAGVRALIVNDGSDAFPYRLLLTANSSGADNAISITSSLTGGTSVTPSWIDDLVAEPGNTYTGTATSGGTYTGVSDKTYTIKIVKGGQLSNATYQVSEDGGLTWGSELSTAAGTIDVYDDLNGTDLGVNVTFGPGTFGKDDLFYVDAHAAIVEELPVPAPEFNAATIGDAAPDSGNVYTGAVTTGGTYTGTSNQAYLVEIVDGGGLAAATYRISEDGGLTWGSTLSLAGGAIDVYDDLNGADLGVDATFADGTFAAGDRFVVDAYVPTVQAAADAELTIGSGAGQITLTSASNTVTDLLPGVTLNLRKADPTQTVEITVENDTATITEQVQAFVDGYNDVFSTIRQQTRYDPQTETAGVLLGNTSVVTIQQRLRQAVLGAVPGLDTAMGGLYAIGVSVSTQGQLSLDTAKLETALQSDFDGVARIFKASGDSTNAKIRFVAAGSATVPSTTGYAVHVTQAAVRGELAGTTIADPANTPLTIDDTNDELVLTISGVETSTLSLAHKTYASGVELANEIAAKIGGSAVAVANVQVTWVDEGAQGHLLLRTLAYGSATSVALGTPPANSAAATLGLSGGTSTAGQDVAGTIDGYAAEGSGRLLKATSTDSDAQGLWLDVTLASGEIGGGVDATVTAIKGVGKLADGVLDYLTDPTDGYVKSKEDRFTSQIERYDAQIERKEALLATRRARLVARFARLEQMLSSLRSQSSYVSSQFSALSGLTGRSQGS